jgi:hypothetical protein
MPIDMGLPRPLGTSAAGAPHLAGSPVADHALPGDRTGFDKAPPIDEVRAPIHLDGLAGHAAVGDYPGVTRRCRRNVDKACPAGRPHAGQRCCGAEEGRFQVDGDCSVELFLAQVFESPGDRDPGVVDQDVDWTELGVDPGDHVREARLTDTSAPTAMARPPVAPITFTTSPASCARS